MSHENNYSSIHWLSIGISWYRNFRRPYAFTKIRFSQKITLEQEFSFQILCVSWEGFPNVITWVILLSKELKLFIIWPSLARIRSTLTDCFNRLHPNVRKIIDCSEIFLTPQVHQIRKLAYGVTTSTTAQWNFLLWLLQTVLCHGCPHSIADRPDIHIVRDRRFLGSSSLSIKSRQTEALKLRLTSQWNGVH